jgi:hypothetical protein
MNILKKIGFLDKKYDFPIASFPFISGDSFKLIADVIYENNKIYRRCIDLQIIFSDINSLEKLSYDIKKFNFCMKTIILHNGDNPPSDELRKIISERGNKLFSTNIIKKYSNETTIPIGIENYHYNNNGRYISI